MKKGIPAALQVLMLPLFFISAQAGSLDQLTGICQPEAANPAVSAPAAVNTVKAETKWDDLKNLFEQGKPAAREDFGGWQAGRRVSGAIPDSSYGALLVERGDTTQAKDPLSLNTGAQFKLSLLTNSDPAWFDDMSRHQVRKIRKMREYPQEQAVISLQDGKGIIHAQRGDATVEYRKSGKSLVEKYYDVTSGITYYSYYFKSVTPKTFLENLEESAAACGGGCGNIPF